MAKDIEESDRWISAIRKAAASLEQLQFAVALGAGTEEVVRTGKMQRITTKGQQNFFFALTSKSLRFYSADFGSSTSLVQDYGKNLVACIPLLGATVEHDPAVGTLSILDVTGNSYLFASKSSADDLRTWEQDISTVSKEMARRIIRDKGVIRLNTYVLPENDEGQRSKGYCVITVSPRSILLNFLMLRRDVKVPWSALKAVDMIGDDIFCLKYKREGEMKQLNIRSRNASGLYDTIEAVHEEITENPQEESEEDLLKPLVKKKSSRNKMRHQVGSPAAASAPKTQSTPDRTPATAPIPPPLSASAPVGIANNPNNGGTHSADNSSADSGDTSQSQSQSAMGLSRSESSGEVVFHDIDNLPLRSRSTSAASEVSSSRELPSFTTPRSDDSSSRTDPSLGSNSGSGSDDEGSLIDDSFPDDGAGSDSEEPPMMPSLPSAEEYLRTLSRKSSGMTTSEAEDSPRNGRRPTKKSSAQSVDEASSRRSKKQKPVQKTISADNL